MEGLRPPDHLVFSGNIAENWRKFRQRFELYLEATESEKERSQKQKAALLLHVAGPEAIEVFDTFGCTTTEKESYDTLLQKFESYCQPRTNETFERYLFRKRVQADGEPFETFLRDLQLKAQSCKFGSLRESMIRDQIVFGTADDQLRERLLREDSLSLESAIKAAQSTEIAANQKRVWQSPEAKAVEAISKEKVSSKDKTPNQKRACYKCKRWHEPKKCPAYGQRCRKCGRKNHFAAACRTKKMVDDVEETRSNSSNAQYEILQVCASKSSEWIINATVENSKLKLKVDTGSQVNLIPVRWLKNFGAHKYELQESKATLRSYSGQAIKHLGTVVMPVTYQGKTVSLKFFVVLKRCALLGLAASEDFDLVRRTAEVSAVLSHVGPGQATLRERVMKDYPNLFRGLGCVRTPYKIVLRQGTRPVIQHPRRVPHLLKQPLKDELQRMSDAGIITRVDEPTEWVSPLVIVRKKSGALRICMDPRNINECLKREHFEMPKREEIEAELTGARIFSRLDANSGFYQIPLDEESSRICTFSTPFGRFRFLRMPFGLASAPEVYQKAMSQVFDGLSGVRVYVDDVLIWGSNEKEHEERLRAALDAAQKHGVTLNAEKCEMGMKEIVFLGDKISEKGIQPSPELISSVLQMPEPSTKQELQRVLGMVTYFGKYVPHLSDRTTLLRELLKHDRDFAWGPEHTKELEAIKEAITSSPVLAVYDPKRECKVSTDASGFGLGAAFFQRHGLDWRPVAYSSRRLTECEKRYSQIEKEALGVVYGCEKFHEFIYGRKVLIETDHQPLISISRKCIGDMPPRLQRLFLRLMRYEYQFAYVPGKLLVLPDTLSRAPTPYCNVTEDEDSDVEVHAVSVRSSLVSDKTSARLVEETAKDPILSDVIKVIQSEHEQPLTGPYKAYRSELSVIGKLLFKGAKVVIPRSLRTEMLSRLHEGHLGINKSLAKARLLMFWPGMTHDIKNMISRCETCKINAYAQPEESLLMREIPHSPWIRVGADLCQYGGKTYLVLYDAYSNYPEVEELQSTSAQEVIRKMSSIFARHGVPLEVLSDNGPQFTSREFARFAASYDFKHITSSPRFPRSNGLAEKGVQVVKHILKKTHHSGGDFYQGLLNYRTSPLECGSSPSELLMNRRLRSGLPDFNPLRSRKVTKRPQRDEPKGTLSSLQPGDIVRLRDEKGWSRKATVLDQVAPRSYRVLTEDRKEYRRNRQHLRPTSEAFSFSSLPDDGMTRDVQLPCNSEVPQTPDQDYNDSAGSSAPVTHPAEPTTPAESASDTQPLRRSMRTRRPTKFLSYDKQFKQIFEMQC